MLPHVDRQQTLRLHRGLAVEKHRQNFQDLARRISINSKRLIPPVELLNWFEQRRPLPEHVKFLEERYSKEPYRLAMALLADDFTQASKGEMKTRLLIDSLESEKARVEHFIKPFEIIWKALANPIRSGRAMVVHRQLKVFGLHAARLDIREESARLNRTLGEILRAIGDHPAYEHVSPAERRDTVIRLLGEATPSLAKLKIRLNRWLLALTLMLISLGFIADLITQKYNRPGYSEFYFQRLNISAGSVEIELKLANDHPTPVEYRFENQAIRLGPGESWTTKLTTRVQDHPVTIKVLEILPTSRTTDHLDFICQGLRWLRYPNDIY